MTRSETLTLSDVRDAFRLIGECRELGREPSAWRSHLLNGLRRMTGAQLALYLHITNLNQDNEALSDVLDAGFLDASHRLLWAHYQAERAQRDDPFHQRYFRDFHGTLLTRRLDSVVDACEWRRSFHYNEYVRACGLEDRITSSVGLGAASTTVQVLVLHRASADGSYAPRAARLVRLFHDELRPLLGAQLVLPGSPAEPPPLPLQLRQVLGCLMRGDAEKQIGDRLGISRHTVNRHVQRLYRRFAVHSRGELMFHCRDWTPDS